MPRQLTKEIEQQVDGLNMDSASAWLWAAQCCLDNARKHDDADNHKCLIVMNHLGDMADDAGRSEEKGAEQ